MKAKLVPVLVVSLLWLASAVYAASSAAPVSFIARRDFVTAPFPTALATSDINGDGVPDLVVTNGFSNNVSILLGKGDATYHAAVSFGAGTNPVSVTVADFDGDGRLDLAVANADSADVSVLLGRGDGTFKR